MFDLLEIEEGCLYGGESNNRVKSPNKSTDLYYSNNSLGILRTAINLISDRWESSHTLMDFQGLDSAEETHHNGKIFSKGNCCLL